MNSIESELITLAVNKLDTQYGTGKVFVTNEYTPTPEAFPCVFIREADNFNADFNGSNVEVVTGVMYEVEVYTNKWDGKVEQAREIMQLIDSIYTPLGLTRTFMQPIPNMYDATIYRLSARYTAAVIGNTIYRR